MDQPGPLRLALLHPPTKSDRFTDLLTAFAAAGVRVERAVYHDDSLDAVRQQLLAGDGVLVWLNPLEGGRDRSTLDALLREVARAGIFVSAHPDMVLLLGTKEVLFRTRDVGWGSDTHLYLTLDQMRDELPSRLATGRARVLKQNRGNGGNGVWRVQWDAPPSSEPAGGTAPGLDTVIRARHARRGAVEEAMTIGEFCLRCDEYFRAVDGRMIDQAYQDRLPEGTIRCYLVHDRVEGFGHQAVNALVPAPPGAGPDQVPQPSPRYYHPASRPEFQVLRRQLDDHWIPAVRKLLRLERESLPVLWDCDFLLGPRNPAGEGSYVLCEINVSSVAPYPDSVVAPVVAATIDRIRTARSGRGLVS